MPAQLVDRERETKKKRGRERGREKREEEEVEGEREGRLEGVREGGLTNHLARGKTVAMCATLHPPSRSL